MITLTESAKNYLSTTTKKSGKKYAYLGVLGGGCSGFQYEWQMTDETDKGVLIEDILVLDKLAEMFVIGCTKNNRNGNTMCFKNIKTRSSYQLNI